MTTAMKDKDVTDAACALAEWFISQEIMQANAVLIMMKLTASLIVRDDLSILDTMDLHNQTKKLLTVEVAKAMGVRHERGYKA